MAIDRKKVLGVLKDLGIFLIASLVQTFLTCPGCRISPVKYSLVFFFTYLMWVFLWMGNSMLTHYISTKIPWIDFPVKRLIVGVITTIAYTLLVVVVLMSSFEYFFNFNFGSGYQGTVYFSIGFTIFISLVLHSHAFFKSWKQARIDAERLEKESIAAKYESLKNQVNPHFLFNSFNALTNLVYEDQEKAVKFIKQLSEVYRYVLDTREKEVVPLSQELGFLSSYIYLQQIRFGDKLKIDVDLKDQSMFIAPLALQMLIENAIKHNVVSEEDPLKIRLYVENGFLVVENNLQKKTVLGEPSARVGLENICKRYKFLSHKEVQIVQENEYFKVKLPLLSQNGV